MADQAPMPRVDNAAMQEFEFYTTEQVLYIIADWIDALGKSGAVYPNLILPPDEAARKRMATQGGQ